MKTKHVGNAIVIYCDSPALLRRHFEDMGLQFKYEKHGGGPLHVACERGGKVLEIYPVGPCEEPRSACEQCKVIFNREGRCACPGVASLTGCPYHDIYNDECQGCRDFRLRR